MGINPRAVRRAQPALLWMAFVACLAGLAQLGQPGERLVGGVVLVVGLSTIISIWRIAADDQHSRVINSSN